MSDSNTPAAPPNILFIMTDQMRYDCTGVSGNRIIQTPNIDRLASESFTLSSCFVQAPVCVPSRQTFFTGRYPHCHRNRVNYTPLPAGNTLLQRYLQDSGYRTAVVGKLHYYPPTRDYALSTGFDEGLIHDAGPCDEYSDYVRWLTATYPDFATDYRRCRDDRPNPFTARISDEAHETTWCGRETRRMMEGLAAQNKPWFLFSSYWKPHSPFEVPEPWSALYQDVEIPVPEWVGPEYIDGLPAPVRSLAKRGDADRIRVERELWPWMYRAYYGAISQIDREVGETLETLDRLGLARQTVVVFCSDHGDLMLEHGMVDKNAFFEAAIHVPFMVRLPGRTVARTCDDLIETTDVLPTLFELCGLEVPGTCQGRSFAWPATEGRIGTPYQQREFVFAENVIPEVITNRRLDFAYVRGEGIKGIRHPDGKMIRSRRWKYNYYVDNGHELYDLEDDPGEIRNLADEPEYRETVDQMRRRLLDWMITADEPDQIAPRWLI